MGEIHEGRVDGPRRVPAPVGMPEDTKVLRYQGGDATNGWLVYYAPGNGVGVDAIGRLCVVRTAQGASYVGRLVRGYTAGVWNVIDLFTHGVIEGVRAVTAAPMAWIKTG